MPGVGRSVLQFVLDPSTLDEDLPMMLRVAENNQMPITVHDHAETTSAAALAADVRHHQ